MAKPENFKVENGPNPGSVKLSLDKISGANSYVYEYSTVPTSAASNWTVGVGTSTKFTIVGLTSGQQYAFRVAGIGADPTVMYSDVLNRYAQ